EARYGKTQEGWRVPRDQSSKTPRNLRMLFAIPTTRRPVFITSLKARPSLPASFVVAEGDFRTLSIARDYDRLVGPSGPIGMRLPERERVSYEIRLSEPFESGRSWEVPVCLAHLLVSAGHTLVTRVEDADVIVWSTGAVDLDLTIVKQNYFIED